MTHTIETESLKVTVDDHGAELVSVYDKERGCERIWCADPAVWNRHAPILFPFVGQVSGKKYRHNGREYEMKTQHGFARDREFEYVTPEETIGTDYRANNESVIQSESGDSMERERQKSIAHRLASDEESLAIYPFPFELTVTHRFATVEESMQLLKSDSCDSSALPGHSGEENPNRTLPEDACGENPNCTLSEDACGESSNRTLIVEWNIKNCGTEDMYYSIGGHPGFAIPVESGVKRDRCYLQFIGNSVEEQQRGSEKGIENAAENITENKMRNNEEKANGSLKYIQINSEGLAVPNKEYTLHLEDGFCPITHDFFDRDALIFERPTFSIVRLALPDKSPYVTMGCMDSFPYVGIWSKPEGEFVCLEPWVGRTDDAGFDGELKDKTGECVLASGETAKYTMVIQFH